MTRFEPSIDRDIVERLLLARLLVRTKQPLSREKVLKAVSSAVAPPMQRERAERAAAEALEACVRRGHVAVNALRPAETTKTTRRVVEKPLLTAQGRKEAPRVFHRTALPEIKSWGQAQQLVGLSLIGRPDLGDIELQAPPLAAAILSSKFQVPRSIGTLPGVVDYLAWRALGVESRAEFSVDAVQRYLLRDMAAGDVHDDRRAWQRKLASHAIGAEGHDARALTRGLLFSSRSRQPKAKAKASEAKSSAPRRQSKVKAVTPKPRLGKRVANDNDKSGRPQPSLTDFAAAVRAAARRPSVARFHDDRAFIGSVWENMFGRAPVGKMSLSDFKQRLIEAHQTQLLRITRADLVSAMDPTEVERSEASYEGATFHFVALEAGGVR